MAASFGAGLINALAGGGTLLTYPALLFTGHGAIVANATSTVALLPGQVTSLVGYRAAVESHRRWLRTLVVPSVLGGALGSALLLRTPEATFARLAPFLILFATVLFAVQGVVSRRIEGAPDRRDSPPLVAAWICQLALAVYGGYFGAGMGILTLAIFSSLGLTDIHAMNGLKNFFSLCVNLVAAACFVAWGTVHWPAALLMAVGSMAGGYAGALLAQRIGRERARTAVVVIGVLSAAAAFLKA